jgi:hypothetical protein
MGFFGGGPDNVPEYLKSPTIHDNKYGKFHKFSLGSGRISAGPSEHSHLYPGSAAFLQDPAAFPGSGPGCENIVHQQDPLPRHIAPEAKSASEIPSPFLAVESLLGWGGTNPRQKAGGHRCPPFSAENPGQKKGLVVGAPAKTLAVQGNRDYQVREGIGAELLPGPCQQKSEGPVQVDSSLVFKPLNGETQAPLVGPGGDDPVEGGSVPGAFLAKMVGSLFGGIGQSATGAARGNAGVEAFQAEGAEKIFRPEPPLGTAEGTGGRQKKIQKAGKFVENSSKNRHSPSL